MSRQRTARGPFCHAVSQEGSASDVRIPVVIEPSEGIGRSGFDESSLELRDRNIGMVLPEIFTHICNQFHDPCLLITATGIVLAFNQSARQLGFSKEFLSRRPLADITDLPVDHLEQTLHRWAAAKVPAVAALPIVNESQKTLQCLAYGGRLDPDAASGIEEQDPLIMLRVVPREPDAGRFAALTEKVNDLNAEIEHRKELEGQLREQRARFEVILASIGEGVLAVDADGNIQFLNPVASQLCGWERPDALGVAVNDVIQVIDEASQEPLENPVQLFLNGGTRDVATQVLLVGRNGNRTPVDEFCGPIQGPDGQPIGAVLVLREVSERWNHQQELQQQREWLRVMLSSIGDGVIATDMSNRVTFINAVAEALTGWRSEQALGQSLEDVFQIFNEQTGQAMQTPADQVLNEGRRIGLANHTLLESRDGTRRPIDDSAAPIRDDQGTLHGIVLVFRDSSEKRSNEQALMHRAEALADADRRKNEFLAMLAHELRNPLAPIRSGLELLSMEASEGDIVSLMQTQVNHLVRLVDDLMDVSRIVRGRVELRMEPVELSTIIEGAVRAVTPLILERQHQLEVNLPQRVVRLEVDPVRISQVVTNLLNNAAKYTELGGHIALSAEVKGDGVVIRVSDDGIGISKELLPYVFDLFRQSERTIDRAQGGLGLGLTLVRSLVEMHDGTVTAQSAGPGQGSEFEVRLPTVSTAPATRPEEMQHPEAIDRRVLVVDDNIGAAKMLRLLLMRCGVAEVTLAHDGPAAIEAAKAQHPDLVLLDIGLPGMNGYEVVRELLLDPTFQKTLFVAVTGYGQEEDIQKSLEAGFDEHLVKPPALQSLLKLFTHEKLQRP